MSKNKLYRFKVHTSYVNTLKHMTYQFAKQDTNKIYTGQFQTNSLIIYSSLQTNNFPK